MKVLIIASNRHKFPVFVMPYGACLAAESAKHKGHDVKLLDLMHEMNPLQALYTALKDFIPDVTGISVRNLDNNDMKNSLSFVDEIRPLVMLIRRYSKSKIILGGAAAGIMPIELLRYTEADAAVTDNGEIVFPLLLEAIENKKDYDNVPSVIWREGNSFKISSSVLPDKKRKKCPVPDFSNWLDLKKYHRNLTTAPLQTKRGCPYQCVYCTYAITEGSEYELNEPESVIEGIKKLTLQGLNDIEFVDNVFNSPYEHAMSICEEIIKNKMKARLHTVELNPRFIDASLLKAMESAGFTGIGITAESASDSVLAGLGKEYTRENVFYAADIIGKSSIPCLWIFLLGGPGETRETIRETLGFAEAHIADKDVAFFNVGIRVYPGTRIEAIARQEGQLTLSSMELLKPFTYLSPQIEKKWLEKTLNDTMARNMNFMNSDTFASKYIHKISRLAHTFGLKPPVWKHARLLRQGLRFIGANV